MQSATARVSETELQAYIDFPSREDGRSYDVALTEAGIAAHAAAREAFDVVNRRFLERLPAPEGDLRATLAGIIAATG